MDQKFSKKKTLPDEVLEKNDHDLMECIFGEKVMEEVDKVVAERSEKDKVVE